MNKTFLLIAIFLLLAGCNCSSNGGTITIVNSTINVVELNLDGKEFKLAPEKHYIQKGLSSGHHKLKADKESFDINIIKGNTTVVDISGDNCFIVADFSDQYSKDGTGKIKIVEKYKENKVFTTTGKIMAELGERLPENVGFRKKATRLHVVDCSWLDKEQAIIDAIANLP